MAKAVGQSLRTIETHLGKRRLSRIRAFNRSTDPAPLKRSRTLSAFILYIHAPPMPLLL
jgi:hypothetical protein